MATVAVVALAGCSDAPAAAADGTPPPAGLGRTCGVIVDDAIRPLSGVKVTVTLPDGSGREQTTDDDGFFCFELPPGTYRLQATHPSYTDVQGQLVVEEGAEGPLVKLQLSRRFSQDPYHVALQLEGFIQCGYDLTFMSSLCVNDYTHFVGPYTCPECEHLVDKRSADFAVDAGWQTMVFEMTWKPTTATSDRMRLVVSHFPRPASHWYCSEAGTTPILLRMDLGVVCEDQQDDPERVPPEGMPNGHLFAAVDAPDGQFVAVTFSQQFTVYLHQFYYGSPPEGWSFVAGNPPPF